MQNLWKKTPGEMVDEASKRFIRLARTGQPDPWNSEYQKIASGIVGTDTTLRGAWDLLVSLNGQIWDSIDAVTSFDFRNSNASEDYEICIRAAQRVQNLNRLRTDTIRQIDALCNVGSTVPEKVHKHAH